MSNSKSGKYARDEQMFPDKIFSMTNEQIINGKIKNECERLYAQIKSAEEKLEELRSKCKHTKTFEGNYSWRVGNIQLADICEYCGSCIRYK